MDQLLSFLSETVPKAQTVEQLTRPLLTLLNRVTGMESTYLTTIDVEQGVQRVEFARNDGDMTIPEGLVVPWEDTLCKRALDENRLYTDNVAECWGDSEAAQALGIRSYVSAPLKAQDGRVLGTVCAASSSQIARGPEVEPTLMLLSGLLSYSLEREILVDRLQAANTELVRLALTDALTGLYNRRAIMGEIPRLLALAKRENKFVLVGAIDLDDFKLINDNHGHQAGDHFLKAISARLQGSLRVCDILGRMGGDEFLVLALGTAAPNKDLNDEMRHAADILRERLAVATIGHYPLEGIEGGLHYRGASVGVAAVQPHELDADEAIKLADAEMYRVKQQRRKPGSARQH